MRDHDDVPYIVIERRGAGLGPFLWGAILGAIAGLLLAPRPGAEIQEDIRRNARRIRSAAEERIESARGTMSRAKEKFEHQVGTVRERVDTVRDRVDSVRERVEGRAERLRGAAEGGQRGARNARREIERRLSDALETRSAAEAEGSPDETLAARPSEEPSETNDHG